MIDEGSIFDISLRCLRDHAHPEWGDRVPLDVFNRLMAKKFRPSGWTQNTHMIIRREDIASRQEQWPTEKLEQFPRGHADIAFGGFDCPIIVVEYEGGEPKLLDGSHRINTWVQRGDRGLHAVNIHTIAGSSGYEELSGVGGGA